MLKPLGSLVLADFLSIIHSNLAALLLVFLPRFADYLIALKYVWTARQIVAELANLKALDDEYGGWKLQKPHRDVLDRATRHVVTYAAHC